MLETITRTRNMDREPSTIQMDLNMKILYPSVLEINYLPKEKRYMYMVL